MFGMFIESYANYIYQTSSWFYKRFNGNKKHIFSCTVFSDTTSQILKYVDSRER